MNIKDETPKEVKPDFEKSLLEKLDELPYTKHVDDGQFNDGQLCGFEIGARWAHEKLYNASTENTELLSQLKKSDTALNEAIDVIQDLKRWKAEHIAVWNEVDTHVREHKEIKLGESVSKKCLEFLIERDGLKAMISPSK